MLDELQALYLGLGCLETVSEMQTCVQAVYRELPLGLTPVREPGKQEREKEGLNCDAVITEASHDPLGALEPRWPFRVVLD